MRYNDVGAKTESAVKDVDCQGKTEEGKRHGQQVTSSFPGQKVQSESQVDEDVIKISEKEESTITSQR